MRVSSPPTVLDNPSVDDVQTYHTDWVVEDGQNSPANATDRYLLDTTQLVHNWTAHWGGVHGWGHALDSGYSVAKESGTLDQWADNVLEHADRGRLIVHMLQQMNGALPKEMWKIRELWRQHTNLLTLVVKGLMTIEVRLDILKPGPFNLWSSSNVP